MIVLGECHFRPGDVVYVDGVGSRTVARVNHTTITLRARWRDRVARFFRSLWRAYLWERFGAWGLQEVEG